MKTARCARQFSPELPAVPTGAVAHWRAEWAERREGASTLLQKACPHPPRRRRPSAKLRPGLLATMKLRQQDPKPKTAQMPDPFSVSEARCAESAGQPTSRAVMAVEAEECRDRERREAPAAREE